MVHCLDLVIFLDESANSCVVQSLTGVLDCWFSYLVGDC